LRLDLYRIDLSSVVSKYIGETEKNLRRVFEAAEESGAILLFDEADTLFGKRSEVRDSHDRYANIEVGYLLQRMEAYRGLAILTTNAKSALDPAFLRRLRFVVHFPFPDEEQRLKIWARVFPAPTPTHGLDFEALAKLQIAGGNIRNIALNAAFLAADAQQPVCMEHVLAATRSEYAKLERHLTLAESAGVPWSRGSVTISAACASTPVRWPRARRARCMRPRTRSAATSCSQTAGTRLERPAVTGCSRTSSRTSRNRPAHVPTACSRSARPTTRTSTPLTPRPRRSRARARPP
jgi:SpoVK/Ycf46/Vps4 family AAA+-type ATPase